MNITICDDEQIILDNLEKQLIILLGEKTNINKYNNINDLLKNIKLNSIDILFIDIKLKDINGIDFVKDNEEKLKNIKIVFITGYSEYVEDIFETNPIYFLQKPITIEKLKKVIDKVKKLNEKENLSIIINIGNEIERVFYKDILFIESYARVLEIHLTNGKTLKTYNKLSEIIKELPATFIKIHKSYIINLDQVINYKTNRIKLNNNQELPISRKNKDLVNEKIMKYLEKSD